MNIKKWLAGLLVVLLVLTGCGSNTNDKEEEAVKEPTDEVVIYIARHGKTMLNTVDRSQGWIDAPLTPAGVEVAEALGEGLKSEGITFDSVYTSDSGRAIETAEIVLSTKGQELEIHKDKRLREYNFGTLEGMPNEDMQAEVAESMGMTYEEWGAHLQDVGFARGILEFADAIAKLDKSKEEEEGLNWLAEDSETIKTRLQEAYDDIVKEAMDNGDSNVLVVSHGMSIATFAYMIDENADIPASGLKNASITRIRYKDGKYTVEVVNDLSYIEKGQ
ncbi:MAG: histidine phosphatase family protein [Coprobacillaceae bacterium]